MFLTSSPPGNASATEDPLRAVDFYAGGTQVGDPNTGGLVRCVRPGTIVAGLPAGAPGGRYTINTDSVVDVKTSLTWQRNPPGTSYSWTDATAYCQALATGGTGWRLPTIKELQSLIDVRSHQPAIDSSAFPGTKPQLFWSSSAYAGNTTAAWAVDFGAGATSAESNDAAHPYQVRCVK